MSIAGRAPAGLPLADVTSGRHLLWPIYTFGSEEGQVGRRPNTGPNTWHLDPQPNGRNVSARCNSPKLFHRGCKMRTCTSIEKATIGRSTFRCIIWGETGYTHSLSPSRPPNNTLNTQSRAQQTYSRSRSLRAHPCTARISPQRHTPSRPSRAPLVGRPPPTGRAPRPPPARPS